MAAAKQQPQVDIRDLREEDIDAVLAIDQKVTGSDRAITYATSPSSDIAGEVDVSVVAEVSGNVVGFLLGQLADSRYELADRAWLQLIGIDPDYQRLGIGSRMMQAFLERCRRKKVQSVRIMISGNDWWMLSFVGSLGFTRAERVEYFKPIEY